MTPSTETIIRERAYMIWEASGRPDGEAETHWFRAIEELDSSPAMTTPEPGAKAETSTRQAAAGAKKARTSKGSPARGSAKKSVKK